MLECSVCGGNRDGQKFQNTDTKYHKDQCIKINAIKATSQHNTKQYIHCIVTMANGPLKLLGPT